jgi:hypothetical protein
MNFDGLHVGETETGICKMQERMRGEGDGKIG